MHNRGNGPGRESERPIVVRKSVNADGAKGLTGSTGSIAAVRGKESRLEEIPVTEGVCPTEIANLQPEAKVG
jgi:hypothetical protein